MECEHLDEAILCERKSKNSIRRSVQVIDDTREQFDTTGVDVHECFIRGLRLLRGKVLVAR